ncbi:LacI family transcriptional regulator [Sphingomonas sp. SORGH_AS 950]|uniref:LacI family DNA-binding transcriptional regulator n=1 Tax=Sphingomonas sp. SORGH_AS_0950 TaxID=3041792 RepID=UPI00278853CB|nr:LacI family DNA-binding transcriptional regulator [Sphingomonas sp. SORGH_AS_0950]MDQ1157633.1 LacI family transcriptional regulator [Sphingomonas sp. SORGH_AS_0950]
MTRTRQRPRGVTIIDVAKASGVSPMTVSRVINGDAGVRDEVRAHVREMIAKLNYTPNLMARSLVTAREIRIGVIYSNPSAAFMSELLVGVFEDASTRAAQLFLLKGENGKPPSRAAIEGLIAQRIAGVLLAPPLGESAAVREILREAGLPVAVIGGVAPDAVCVGIDNNRAAYDMTRHLIGLGHRRLGFVLGNPDQSASIARLAGFRAAVEEAGGIETQVVQGDYSYASGLVAGETLLDGATPPTAIFASNDDMAAAIVSVAHRRHLDVPGDLTVAGFDDSIAATTLWPPLTTVHQPVRALAEAALQMLIQEIRGGAPRADGEPRVTILDHRLVERDSTAAPRP